MLYNLLAIADPFRKASIGEAALYALIGFAVVFIGILFLILIVWGTGKIFSATDMNGEKGKEKKAKESVEKVEIPSVAESLAVASDGEEEISEETVAIITAAIMAYYQKNNPKCEFTVKRIKRI